ncbi:MAG: trifunctional dihydropteroate synthetase [Piccolia ochrophora]|nr:MAG: trifunctional dihydropteroate synthetase [Piccolia ochrophora]
MNGNAGHRAFIALGSNLGNRVAMIEEACRHMTTKGIRVLRTSSLWETAPMYVTNQNSFVNGACEVETSLPPIELLDQLQAIEIAMGRKKTIEKGPRNIDLDILFYDNDIVDHPRLNIPHKSILERQFVLRPLCELIPNAGLPSHTSDKTLLEALHDTPTVGSPMSTLTPFSWSCPPITSLVSSRPTHVMAILNITLDSFSDGGLYSSQNMKAIKSAAADFIAAGATILDVGGQSSRPGADDISPQEEVARVVPVIEAIRTIPGGRDVAISIDTYRALVAEEAVKAGADMVNDISGGTMDEAMLPTVARLGVTICLMHMRGTPQTMTKLTSYPNGLIPTVGQELRDRVRAAEAAGVRRWRMMLDPGIGFAKNQAQNLEILRGFSQLKEMDGLKELPWLVGASRKGFIGKITGVAEAKERSWGTAAAVAAAVAGGADIVRVHDVKEMSQVVKMADAIWRV